MSRDILLKGSQRCFPFDENICFELLEIYSDEWNSIFYGISGKETTSRGIPKFSETLYREFPFRFIFQREFSEFGLKGSLLENSTFFVFSGNFPRKFPYHFSPFRIF